MGLSMNDLKTAYQDIEVPHELTRSIEKGIQRGQNKMNQSKNNIMKVAASLIVLGAVFTGAVNVSPTFADMLEEVPVLGQVVKVLRFVDHEAQGGQIDDGVNLDEVVIVPDEDQTALQIHFSKNDQDISMASSYVLRTYDENILSFEVSGVRYMDMTKDYEAISQVEGVEDIYTIMTLDDSMVRFNLVIDPSYTFEIIEYESPAMLEIVITSGQAVEKTTVYEVRSHSYEMTENFSIMEESFMHQNIDYSILKDQEGDFLYSLGRFESREDAEAFMNDLDIGIDLMIDDITKHQVPNHIK